MFSQNKALLKVVLVLHIKLVWSHPCFLQNKALLKVVLVFALKLAGVNFVCFRNKIRSRSFLLREIKFVVCLDYGFD